MDFDLSSEQQMIKDTVRDFVDKEVSPAARENDLKERFPRELLQKMAPLGLLGGPIPVEYGGAGLDYISHAIITEEIGRGCSSLRTTLSVQISLVELTILKWGTEEQKKKYLSKLCKVEMLGCFGLTEPDAGSDAGNQSTTAVLKNNEWFINGTKIWISNGTVADIAIVFAQIDKSKKHKGIAAFLIEKGTKGFTANKITGKLGLRSSDTGELVFADCRVSKENLLGQAGDGFKIAMFALDNGRYSVAAGSVGIIQGCLDACVKYAKQRQQFGKPIGSFQLIQEKIAKMAVDLDAARLLVYRAGHLKNKGIRNTTETSMAKLYASEAAVNAASEAIQIHGAYGYSNEYPLERYYRDAKVATIYEGTSEIQKLIIAGNILGIKAFV
ncbi:MAG: acyl-CoA dehydrogenase [Nitrospirae bacterium RBG_19FT_COMBO_42_15]|nr:MAG: acyl-CoA dehydrogenase [Nitrospirae bacterium RBG_19FT_COMBO_42_15]